MGRRPKGWDLSAFTPAPPEMVIRQMRITFEDQNPDESKQLSDDLQNPASPSYHRWLTPEQQHAHFGETESQFRAVKNWLIQQHFRIVQESYGKGIDWIAFSGTMAQVEAAFHIRMVWYKATDKYTNIDDPQIPAQFKGVIHAVIGLYNIGGAIPLFQVE